MPGDAKDHSQRSAGLFKVLVFWDLVIYGLAYISPIGPFSTWGCASALSAGAAPLAYALAACGLLFTALSYTAMASEIPGDGGPAYAYTRFAYGITGLARRDSRDADKRHTVHDRHSSIQRTFLSRRCAYAEPAWHCGRSRRTLVRGLGLAA
jgi:hypothetical protein